MSVISDFHDILADFNTSVSVVIAPADWIDASSKHVLATLRLVGVSGEEYARFAQATMIYPCLLVYAFAHVKFCTNPRTMEVFQAELSKWNEYDDLTRLLNHNSISRTLWDFLGQCRENSHSCNASVHIEKLLNIDITGIAAHILLILRDPRRRKMFLIQRESRAQALLDLLQKLLDFVSLDPRFLSPIVSAIVKLSKHSGLYPECLTIRGVQKLGQDPVAGGSFGDIWKGEVGGHPIAIKVMRIFGASDVDKVLKAFSYEAVLWRQLSHSNLLPFYGVYHWNDEHSRICLISPWMTNGNVLQYLERSPHVDRVSLLSDVALGLKYLHSRKPSVVHGDLKGANILITPSLRACITDFGLATLANDSKVPLTSSSSMASSGGTLRWQAPELLNYEGDGTHNRNSLASDIYAFGCVCYEIFVGRPPFFGLTPEYRVISAVVQGNRPRRPSLDLYAARGLDDAIWALINKCWGMNPTQRPSADNVVQSLLSRSSPDGSPPPTCDWDEAIVSRLRSTLAGHRWSGPTHPPEKVATIRTMTADATSEAPSISRPERSSITGQLIRKREAHPGPKHARDCQSSEGHVVDLSGVMEETEESSTSSDGHTRHEGKGKAKERERWTERPEKAPSLHTEKGTWPDDFLDAVQGHSQTPPISPASPPPPPLPDLERQEPMRSPPADLPTKHSNSANGDSNSGSDIPVTESEGEDVPDMNPLALRPRIDDTLAKPRRFRFESKPSLGISPLPTLTSPTRKRWSPLVPTVHSKSPDEDSNSSSGEMAPNANGRHEPAPHIHVNKPEVIDVPKVMSPPPLRTRIGDKPGEPPQSMFDTTPNLDASGTSSRASASDLLISSSPDLLDEGAVRKALIITEDGKPPTHFQLGGCIGRGQFSSVYRALNLNTGQMVAVKRIQLESFKEEEVTALMREIDLVKCLSHPSIVKYEGVARDGDTLSIVLEYVENGSLGQILKAFGKMNELLIARYIVKILEGLHFLHQNNVVHYNLKATNILTTKTGNVKLSEFGVLFNLRVMQRENKNVAGTPNWMAPEVVELKGASTKADIWSLACTVVELLTGRPPYAEKANGMSVMFSIVENDQPPIPEGCSPLLQDFLTLCFNKDPIKRPSADILCEHPWLKKNWSAHKAPRPQDNILPLPLIDADLGKLYKRRAVYFPSQIELPETPLLNGPQQVDDGSPPGHLFANSSTPSLPDIAISTREHSFVKTAFDKPRTCRVCLLTIKNSAVLCSQCSLISHFKCAVNAPPTCDLRAQLLLYAREAEKVIPATPVLGEIPPETRGLRLPVRKKKSSSCAVQ